MRDRSLLIGVPLAVIMSAAIAYVLVFWTPWFKPTGGGWVTTSITDYQQPSYYDGSYDFFPDINDLKKYSRLIFKR